jgi:hypothetical protein
VLDICLNKETNDTDIRKSGLVEEKNKHPKYYLMNTASVLCRVLCIGKTNSEVAVHKGSSRKDKEEKKGDEWHVPGGGKHTGKGRKE